MTSPVQNLPHPTPTALFCLLTGFSQRLLSLKQASHLPGADGAGFFFSKHGCIVGQILAHHLITGEEEEVGLGAFNSLCIVPNCTGGKEDVFEERVIIGTNIHLASGGREALRP